MPFPLLVPLISAGLGAIGQWYETRQKAKAAGQQIDMSKEALEMEKYFFERSEQYQKEQDTEDKRRYDQEFNRGEQRYQQERDDFSPYASLGGSALSSLAWGTGLPQPTRTNNAERMAPKPYADGTTSPTPIQPWNTDTMGPIPSLSSLGGNANVSGGAMTTIRTPTGQQVLVPAAKVKEALANGGTVVNGAAA